MLEVGPGLGVLTSYLADRVSFVHTVEIDRRWIASSPPRSVSEPTWASCSAMRCGSTWTRSGRLRRKLVANLPYNVAAPLIVESLDGLPGLGSWCVMVQREIADRFFAEPGTKAYGAVTVLVRLAAERTGFHAVSRTVFRPRPRVESALVAFRRRPLPDRFAQVKAVVEAAFRHRRKMLANSIETSGLASKEATWDALDALGLDRTTRAEALPPDAFPLLAERLA